MSQKRMTNMYGFHSNPLNTKGEVSNISLRYYPFQFSPTHYNVLKEFHSNLHSFLKLDQKLKIKSRPETFLLFSEGAQSC